MSELLSSSDHAPPRGSAPGARAGDPVFDLHRGGKIEVSLSVPLDAGTTWLWPTRRAWPGSAWPSQTGPSSPARYTEANTVAVVSDGTAVLGLGNIGPAAALPVMEGKAAAFQGLCRHRRGADRASTRTDADEIVETVPRIAPVFGGINLEDISAPALLRDRGPAERPAGHPCVPRRSARHRDRGAGRAAQCGAGWPARAVGDLRVVVSGAGAAGSPCTKILLAAGIEDIVVADSQGNHPPRPRGLIASSRSWRPITQPGGLAGSLQTPWRAPTSSSACPRRARGAEADRDDGRRRRSSSRWPTRIPEVRRRWRTGMLAVVATGRSDYPNQINNVLAFPGIFRGRSTPARRDHREHEAGRGPGHRRRGRGLPYRRTTSCPRRSTRGCARPSARRSPHQARADRPRPQLTGPASPGPKAPASGRCNGGYRSGSRRGARYRPSESGPKARASGRCVGEVPPARARSRVRGVPGGRPPGRRQVPEPKHGKNRMHPDLRVTDSAAEVARLAAPGRDHTARPQRRRGSPDHRHGRSRRQRVLRHRLSGLAWWPERPGRGDDPA